MKYKKIAGIACSMLPLVCCGVVLILAGCSDDAETLSTAPSLRFEVSVNGGFGNLAPRDGATRGSLVDTDGMYDSFGVSAYCYRGEWSESLSADYFYDALATKYSGVYSLTTNYRWPGKENKMRFFAYAPKGYSNYKLSDKTQKGSPTLTVNLPAGVPAQYDLLVAKTGELPGDFSGKVELKFQHLLTGIRFVAGNGMVPCTLKSIVISDACGSGIYDMATDSWRSLDNHGQFFLEKFYVKISGQPGEVITASSDYFFMLPQTLREGARIEVTYNTGGADRVAYASIAGHVWEKGKIVTYHISLN